MKKYRLATALRFSSCNYLTAELWGQGLVLYRPTMLFRGSALVIQMSPEHFEQFRRDIRFVFHDKTRLQTFAVKLRKSERAMDREAENFSRHDLLSETKLRTFFAVIMDFLGHYAKLQPDTTQWLKQESENSGQGPVIYKQALALQQQADKLYQNHITDKKSTLRHAINILADVWDIPAAEAVLLLWHSQGELFQNFRHFPFVEPEALIQRQMSFLMHISGKKTKALWGKKVSHALFGSPKKKSPRVRQKRHSSKSARPGR